MWCGDPRQDAILDVPRLRLDGDGDTLTVLDVLAKQVGVRGMFSDWPATTTFYASCMGLK